MGVNQAILFIYFSLKYSCCTVLYKLQGAQYSDSQMFKGYTPFIVIKQYWLYIPHVAQYILVADFIRNTLYLLLPSLYVFPPPAPHLPTGDHKFVLYICDSGSFLLSSLVCCIF